MKFNHKLIKSLSLGIVSLGLLAGIGITANHSNNVHADADDEAMAEDIAETEQSDKDFDANSERSSMQTTWYLRHTWGYPDDLVSMLNSYPDLVNSPKAKSMINYLSPKGREEFDEYYFNNSSTGAGLHLKKIPDSEAGLDYDPHNSADNYLPLAHQHYISTAQEKKLQNPVTSLFSNDSTKPKHHHAKKVAKHHYNKKHNKVTKSHHAKKANRNKKHGKKANKNRARRHNRRTKKSFSKKQIAKLNKQLKNDKRALKSRRAKHNYKLRKSLNKSIKNINKKLRLLK